MQPWSLSPCLRLSQACKVKDLPLSLPFMLSVCFVRYNVRQGKTLLSFITNPNFLDFFAIILHNKHSTRYCVQCCNKVLTLLLHFYFQPCGWIQTEFGSNSWYHHRAWMQAIQIWAARDAACAWKPKLAFAQRGNKFAVAQSFKQLISSSLLQHRGQWCSKDSSSCLLMQRHFGQVMMFSRNLRNWRGRSLICVLREENWTHIFQRQRSRCPSIAGGEHHFTLVSSCLVMQNLICPRLSTDPVPGKEGT